MRRVNYPGQTLLEAGSLDYPELQFKYAPVGQRSVAD